jgi:hypothetical protein
MQTLQVLATCFLGLTIVLCGGVILWYLGEFFSRETRVEEIRHLRQDGLMVNQEGEV